MLLRCRGDLVTRVQIAPVKVALAALKGLSMMTNDMFRVSNKSLLDYHLALNIIQTLLSASYSFSVDMYIATTLQLHTLLDHLNSPPVFSGVRAVYVVQHQILISML